MTTHPAFLTGENDECIEVTATTLGELWREASRIAALWRAGPREGKLIVRALAKRTAVALDAISAPPLLRFLFVRHLNHAYRSAPRFVAKGVYVTCYYTTAAMAMARNVRPTNAICKQIDTLIALQGEGRLSEKCLQAATMIGAREAQYVLLHELNVAANGGLYDARVLSEAHEADLLEPTEEVREVAQLLVDLVFEKRLVVQEAGVSHDQV